MLSGQPIKFCVNNNPSSNNRIVDCGAIRLSDLPRVNISFLSAECYARRAWITFCGQEILFSGANQADNKYISRFIRGHFNRHFICQVDNFSYDSRCVCRNIRSNNFRWRCNMLCLANSSYCEPVVDSHHQVTFHPGKQKNNARQRN